MTKLKEYSREISYCDPTSTTSTVTLQLDSWCFFKQAAFSCGLQPKISADYLPLL